jgi:hypothetical protein
VPPSFNRINGQIDTKFIKDIADTIVPEIVQDNELQDTMLKSVNALPQRIDEQALLQSMSTDLSKSLVGGKAIQKGEADPKSFFFDPYAFSDSLNHRAAISGLSYGAMNQMVLQCAPIAAIINTRLNQLCSFSRVPRNPYAMGFRVEREDGERMSASERKEAKGYEQFFLNMGGGDAAHERDHLDMFLKKEGRDRLQYDQVNFERVFTYGGALHEVATVDASSIRIALRKYIDETDPRKDITDNQIIPDRGRGFSRVNVPINEKAYIQIANGQILTEYTEREMAFCVNWPRTELKVAGYGYGEIEQLISVITGILFASEYNKRFFSSGSSPKGVLNVKGNMSQLQLDSLKKAWLAQLSGLSGSWRTPILAVENGLEFINMQQTNREMEFSKYQDFLIKIACGVYQIAPEEINFSSTTSSSGQGAVFESKGELRLKSSRDKGLVPLLMFFENMMNREIMRFLNPKYRFVFVGLDGGTEADKIKMSIELMKFKTVDEVRDYFDGSAPVKFGEVIDNTAFMQAYMDEKKVKQANKTMETQRGFQIEDQEMANQQQEQEVQRQNEEALRQQEAEQQNARMEQEAAEKEQKAQAKKPKPKKKPVRKAFGEEGWDDDDQEILQDELQKAIKSGDFEGAAGLFGGTDDNERVVINLEV